MNGNLLWLHNLTEKLILVSKNKEIIYHIGIHLITLAYVLNGSLDARVRVGLRPYYTAQRETIIIFVFKKFV